MREISYSLFESVTVALSSISRLNEILSTLIEFSLQFSEEPKEVANLTCHLLERLPAWPLALDRIPDGIPVEHFIQTISDAERWQRLKVVNHVSNSVLRVALTVLVSRRQESVLKNFINNLAELFESASGFASAAPIKEASWRWFTVEACLWTSW